MCERRGPCRWYECKRRPERVNTAHQRNMARQPIVRLAKRFRRLYAGVVYDAMAFDVGLTNFTLDEQVKPLVPCRRPMVGPAFTCHGNTGFSEAKDTLRLEMLRDLTPGCVLVIDTDMNKEVAHFGDISAELAKHHGAVGVVIEGHTRDATRLRTMGWPVFCQGAKPQDAWGRWQIEDWNCAIWLGPNVFVNPKDWVFADDDGVLVIPERLVVDVCVAAEKRAKQERRIRRALRKHPPEEVYRSFGRW